MTGDFVSVGDVQTYLLRVDADAEISGPLILIIPGNPGVPDYYEGFMERLEKLKQDREGSIWCVSHAGHVPIDNKTKTKAKAEKSFYTLDDQVDHKINFISQYVPVSVKLILVGHSIGCYIILKMLERLHASRVLKCVLLFPVIERLSVTNQGRVFNQLLKYFRWYTPAVTYPLGQLVPVSVKQSLIRWYLGSETEDFVIKATSKFINYTVLHNHVNLAHLELKHLHEADHEVIQRNIDKLMMYYGTSDRWCPVSYYEDMIRIYPDADIRLCQRDIQHAFVLRDSTQMADIVWQWLCERLPTLCEDN